MKFTDKLKAWNERRIFKKIERFAKKLCLTDDTFELACRITPQTPVSMYYTLRILEEMQKRYPHSFITNYPIRSYQMSDEEIEFLKACRHSCSDGDPLFVTMEVQQ